MAEAAGLQTLLAERTAKAHERQAEAGWQHSQAAQNFYGLMISREAKRNPRSAAFEPVCEDGCEEYGVEADERYIDLMQRLKGSEANVARLEARLFDLCKVNVELGKDCVDTKVENMNLKEQLGIDPEWGTVEE
jgi:hypothetical protein